MRVDSYFSPKQIDNPRHISALVPTRGRPENLEGLFANFNEKVADKTCFDVWLYVDDDDLVTLAYIASNQWTKFPFTINWHVAAPTSSMGEMFNYLWQINSTNPGIYFPCGDDILIKTQDWDTIMLEAFTSYDDGIMLGFLPEQTASPFQVTYPALSAQWLNHLGYFFTSRFYFWFDDMWLDDIAQMLGRKKLIPVYITTPTGKGKTPRMRNLAFWTRYYSATLYYRYKEASRLIDIIYEGNESVRTTARLYARNIAAIQLHKQRLISCESIQHTEQALVCDESGISVCQKLNYLKTELMAVHDLLEQLKMADATGDSHSLIELSGFLEHSSCRIPEIHYIKASHLTALGYHREALLTIKNGLQLFPNDEKNTTFLNYLEEKRASPDTDKECYDAGNSFFNLPFWLDVIDTTFLLFPDEIDQELFFIIQRIIYDVPSVITMLDVGAGNGNGSTRAIMEATAGRTDTKLFCIEPDHKKCKALYERYAERIKIYEGLSVSSSDYMQESELISFYQNSKSIYNFYPYSLIQDMYFSEIIHVKNASKQGNLVQKIKNDAAIDAFDLVVLDGSLFTGKADLAAVYGARFLVLNYVWSSKNFHNFGVLLNDPHYKMAISNLNSRCGYVIFEWQSD